MSTEEREGFSKRLRQCLESAGYPCSPTCLTKEFNLRSLGKPVTVHAARKWMFGEAIPTQEKMQVLSAWFGVSPEWLRFGVNHSGAIDEAMPVTKLNRRDHVTLGLLHRLSDRQRHLVDAMISTICKMSQQEEEWVDR